MDPKEYYYSRFRKQFDEFISKTTMMHEHPSEGTYIPIQDLNKETLSHIPESDYMLFHSALACTVLIDQVMFTYFKDDYAKFQEMTRYPKFEYGITNINISPWSITHSGIGLTTFERFFTFFVDDLKLFFSTYPFKHASWDTVRRAMLNDTTVTSGSQGEIVKKILG